MTSKNPGSEDPFLKVPGCPLCGGVGTSSPQDAAELGLKPPFGVLRCPDCSFRWQSPRPSGDAFHELYEAVYHSDSVSNATDWKRDYPGPPERLRRSSDGSSEYVTAQHAHYLRQLSVVLPSRGRLLEVGCSTGDFLLKAQRDGWEVLGIEPSQVAVDRALNAGLPVKQGMFADYKSEIGEFDAVFLGHVFEHLDNPADFAREIQLNLRPGGVLFLEVPNQFESLSATARRFINFLRNSSTESTLFSIHHVSFFSPRTLASVLNDAGFGDVEIGHWVPRARNPAKRVANKLGAALGRSSLIQATARRA